jgi:phosphoadenosine phosphosulfate reductase
MTLQEKIDYSIALIKKAEPLALRYSPDGFYLAFSGGKDSQVIYHLAKEAGVKFKAHMNLTSVDPPTVIRFVREHYPDVELHRPKESIYQLIPKKHGLPTQRMRWCCFNLKEQSGEGTVTILGIRREESIRRANRNEIETTKKKFSGNFDQFSVHNETEVSCLKGKDKIMLSPILLWTEKDVWEYLNGRNIPHCELYDMGYKRIGCILCPMSNKASARRDRKLFPKVEKAYKKAIAKLLIVHPQYGRKFNGNIDMIFEWWISKKSQDKFIADEISQGKLKFYD